MASVQTDAWYTARITATQAMIEAYETAITAIAANGVQSYTLDTGQTRQVVTRADLANLQRILDILYNRIATLEARRDGTGVFIGGAGW